MIFNCMLVGLSLMAFSDTAEIDQTLETVLEAVELDETMDIADLAEHLETYLRRPLNINAATVEELEQLGLLNDFQIAALLQYRLDYGDLASIAELQYVPGFTTQVAALLQPFVRFQKTEVRNLTWNNIRRYGTSTLMTRYTRGLMERRGFSSDIVRDTIRKNAWYLGSPDVLWLRYQFNAMNKLKIGFVAKKDAGEEFFRGSQKNGFPFYSGYVALSDVGRIKSLVVGNYLLQFGQGLCLWSGFALGKSVDGSYIQKKPQGIKPYGSSTEYGYFQGIAGTVNLGKVDVSAFFSHRRLDATVAQYDENGHPQSISSIVETGYHRTIGELEKENTANQTLFGTHIDRRWSRFRIGATAHYNGLDVDYSPQTKPYNQFSAPPKNNVNVGLDWEGIGGIARYYGEVAMSKNGAPAFIVGSRFLLHHRLSANVSVRYYDKSYQNFFAHGVAENGGTFNEKALNISLFADMSKVWKVAMMTDIFAFPWLSTSANEPLFGQEYQLKISCYPNPQMEGYAYYRYKTKESLTTDIDDAVDDFELPFKHSIRANFDHKISDAMALKSRVEYAFSERKKGVLMYQDFHYRFRKCPLMLTFRYALYDVDDYSLRIFVYEHDVLYGSALHHYYDKGSRFFVVLQYELSQKVTCWLKFSNTNFAEQPSISSGLDEIDGRDNAEIKLQLRFRF